MLNNIHSPLARRLGSIFILILSALALLSCAAGPTDKSAQSLTPLTIHMIGDSTMANKPVPNDQNERGWGQMLAELVKPEARVANYAQNGRSSKSFIGEGLWDDAEKHMQAGDWLIIQFGHNDAKPDEARHTEPFADYSENLRMYVEVARSKGVQPILCTSIVRGNNLESHKDYPKAVKALAQELNVPLLDMESITKTYVAALGEAHLKEMYIQKDFTHLNIDGGRVVAKMAADEIKRLNLPLSAYFK